ncbi:MAG TPA: hypothetical protein PKA64_04615 [Myxococcota bacterium]|nr:hypothetical protein [Myxococcota bacterium]
MEDQQAEGAIKRYRGAVGAAIAIAAVGHLTWAVWQGCPLPAPRWGPPPGQSTRQR